MKEHVIYKHSQGGGLVAIVLGIFALWLGYLVYRSHQLGLLAPLTVLLLAAILFWRLTVEMDEEFIEVRFGPGVIRKKWRLGEIESCGPVRNRWWHGWGIHWIARKTWLFNISGWDAVELWMKDGKIFRIGILRTGQPPKVLEMIRWAMKRDA